MDDDIKTQRTIDHAWRYFELHAQQRMTVFNFYLAISGLIAAGVGVCLQQGSKFSFLASLLGVFLGLVSFLFWKLDQRVSELIKLAESTLCKIELATGNDEILIFSKERLVSRKGGLFSIWTYGRCFRMTFLSVGLIGGAFAVLPHVVDFSSKPDEGKYSYRYVIKI
ncbi:hypothetical protein [Pseudomonas sp. R9.37]|uniref:hypothetical protein n=1 Tax=Pseudomonas sp. R9.37 TaxID=1390498 RepID=UPI000D0D0499|nr:hypothetical protein [Pseudomonas sp. R9.37]PSL93753.1 hypothetical protein C7U57_10885 [Pseudomonas sp. R9.37]